MALNKKDQKIDSSPKSTLQGQGKNTKYSKTSRNSARKKYRGQGKGWDAYEKTYFYIRR
jgi:hypothetical protein